MVSAIPRAEQPSGATYRPRRSSFDRIHLRLDHFGPVRNDVHFILCAFNIPNEGRNNQMLDYDRMGYRKLRRVLQLNPPDVPHYQLARDALDRLFQFWGLVLALAGIAAAVMRLFIR
jgi:hypothetical protein